MGGCCSSESALDDGDSHPRPRPQTTRPATTSKPRVNKAVGRTLGGGSETGSDPRTAAAIAAEAHIPSPITGRS